MFILLYCDHFPGLNGSNCIRFHFVLGKTPLSLLRRPICQVLIRKQIRRVITQQKLSRKQSTIAIKTAIKIIKNRKKPGKQMRMHEKYENCNDTPYTASVTLRYKL